MKIPKVMSVSWSSLSVEKGSFGEKIFGGICSDSRTDSDSSGCPGIRRTCPNDLGNHTETQLVPRAVIEDTDVPGWFFFVILPIRNPSIVRGKFCEWPKESTKTGCLPLLSRWWSWPMKFLFIGRFSAFIIQKLSSYMLDSVLTIAFMKNSEPGTSLTNHHNDPWVTQGEEKNTAQQKLGWRTLPFLHNKSSNWVHLWEAGM